MRLYILTVLSALGPIGCIAQIGGSGVVFGVGQVESCSGDYSYSEETGRWSCKGQFVAGAAISDSGARALGGVAEAGRSVAATVLGLPQPAKSAPAPVVIVPQPAPKETGP